MVTQTWQAEVNRERNQSSQKQKTQTSPSRQTNVAWARFLQKDDAQ